MTVVVRNETRDVVLAANAEVARGPWGQFVGLMGRRGLAAGGGLVLPRTRAVHSHFMRFTIDVLFFDREYIVIGMAERLSPWRLSRYYWKASGAVELPGNALAETGTRIGDRMSIAEIHRNGPPDPRTSPDAHSRNLAP
ncbi:MAG: DUF192 domain-containing protein [Chloroflexota bacterium]|nr:MAG: DUF192 domain-containing protein [Chloroflexota bacterium]